MLRINLSPVHQQDGEIFHTAKTSMHWFESHEIALYEHPPYSLYLNFIEHISVYVKHNLHVICPDIVNIKKATDTIKSQLAEVLHQVWEVFNEHFFESIVDYMADCVQTVLNSKEWYMIYWGYICGRVRSVEVTSGEVVSERVVVFFLFCFLIKTSFANSNPCYLTWICQFPQFRQLLAGEFLDKLGCSKRTRQPCARIPLKSDRI